MDRFDKLESRMLHTYRRVDDLMGRDDENEDDPEDYGDPSRREIETDGRFPTIGLRNRWGPDRGNRRDHYNVGGCNVGGYNMGGYQARWGRQPARRGETAFNNRHNRHQQRDNKEVRQVHRRSNWDPPWYRQDTWEDEDQYDDRRPTCWHPPLRTHGRHVEEIRAHPLPEPPPQYTPTPFHQPPLVKTRKPTVWDPPGQRQSRGAATHDQPFGVPPYAHRLQYGAARQRSCRYPLSGTIKEDKDSRGEGKRVDIELFYETDLIPSQHSSSFDQELDAHHQSVKLTDDVDLNLEREGDSSAQLRCWGSDDKADVDGADVSAQQQNLVQPMMMELESRKIGCLPTISKESVTPKVNENLRPRRIDHTIKFKDVMDGIQSYTKEMRKRDILNYRASHDISYLQPEETMPFTAGKTRADSALPRFLDGKGRRDLKVVYVFPFDPGGKPTPHAVIRWTDGWGPTTWEPAAPLKVKFPDLFLEDKEDSNEGGVDTSTTDTASTVPTSSATTGPSDSEETDTELDVPEPGAADTSVRPEVSDAACMVPARKLGRQIARSGTRSSISRSMVRPARVPDRMVETDRTPWPNENCGRGSY